MNYCDNSQQPIVASAPGRAGLYLLQVNGANSSESFPLHLLVNELENTNEQYLIPLPQAKPGEDQRQPQLCNDAYEYASTLSYYVNNQDYQIAVSPQSLQLQKQTEKAVPENTPVATKSSIESDQTENNCNSYLEDARETQVQPEKIKTTGRKQTVHNFVHISDRVVPPRALAVLPTELQMRRGCVSPRRSLTARVRFGPLRGIIHKRMRKEANDLLVVATASRIPIFLLKNNVDSVHHIDVSDKDKSNWMGLLPLGDQSTANVWLYEEEGELYGITTKSIASRTPLALGYSKTYAEEHNLPSGQPVLDLQEESPGSKRWWCTECACAMGSSALLQRHIDVYHKDDKPPPRRRYRCSQCSRTFSRLFSLRRHTLQICTKKPEKSNNETNVESPDTQRDVLCSTPNVDDSKLPSDESFQNYTNGLDFSTNLFDTDRMPNLDISGSSRSEAEFNPYSVGYKEDNCLANDIGFSKGSINDCNNKETKTDERILVSCPYCDQTIIKEKRRQHILRECKERRFKCECGHVFNKKQNLAVHIHTEHSEDLKTRTFKVPDSKQSSDLPYKCEECKHGFKRRGMLVNHLWRVHKLSASVPLERRVRHYPCVVCPKIYRAAAKRDRHVRKHHPGAELIRAAPIEGERRAYEPAACAACPRQYATRAKLLQHVRAHHPHLAPPAQTTTPLKSPYKRKKQAIESTSSYQQSVDLY